MSRVLKITLCVLLILFVLLFLLGFLVPEETTLEENQQIEKSEGGRFIVQYTPVTRTEHQIHERVIRESRLFEIAAEELTSSLILPQDIVILFKECKEANAFYDPSKPAIVMCYELFDEVVETFSEDASTDEELGAWTLHTILFIFYHELGHALVHQFDLPITGKEEDAVDQLSTIILTNMGEEGENVTLNGAYFFFIRGQDTNIEELAFWDEHSLDEQRFYNIACWVYGKNPAAHQYLIKDEWLPEERAIRCEQEYKQISNSWNRILDNYVPPK